MSFIAAVPHQAVETCVRWYLTYRSELSIGAASRAQSCTLDYLYRPRAYVPEGNIAFYQMYAHSLVSGMTGVAERVDGRVFDVRPQLRVVAGGTGENRVAVVQEGRPSVENTSK